jgi:hypothetical protein
MKELLTNNSNEMKTVVETFIIEETESLIYDNEKLDDWNKHVAELGLKGQNKIVKPNKSPIPFMFVKSSMKSVFETLCPRKVNVESYDVTPIPLEILELIALSKKEDYFNNIEIWYDDKDPDPLCLGVLSSIVLHKKGTYTELEGLKFSKKSEAEDYVKENNLKDEVDIYDRTWDAKYYLLGKWADVKHSFEELKEKAKARYIAAEGNNFRKTIKEAQRNLDDLELKAFELFN